MRPWFRQCYVRQVHPYYGYILGGCRYLPGAPREGTPVLILETHRERGGILMLVQYVSRGLPVRAILPKEGSMFGSPRGPRPPWRRHHNPLAVGAIPFQFQMGSSRKLPPAQDCPPGQFLRNNRCQPQMCGPRLPCPPGTTCVGGRCLPSRHMNPVPALYWRF